MDFVHCLLQSIGRNMYNGRLFSARYYAIVLWEVGGVCHWSARMDDLENSEHGEWKSIVRCRVRGI
jgi:hypothetical protein